MGRGTGTRYASFTLKYLSWLKIEDNKNGRAIGTAFSIGSG